GPPRVYVPGAKGGVAVSRALGLFAFKPAVGAEPETTRFARQEDDLFLVLGSDGVFDYLDIAKIRRIVVNSPCVQSAADAVIAAVLKAGAPDNATIAVLDLGKRAAP